MREFADVHDRRCCKIHGCKYCAPDCTVESGQYPGVECEICFDNSQDPTFIRIKQLEDENAQLKKRIAELIRGNFL